ncbi:MAG: hypothetical protein ACE5E7_08275 [Anaerolineae bacterium]
MYTEGLVMENRIISLSRHEVAEMETKRLYESMCHRSMLERIRMAFSKQANKLTPLPEVVENAAGQPESHYLGRQTVSLSVIRGSSNSGRTIDFDANFCPRHTNTKQRWFSIATARKLGKGLPPVRLIQHGNTYFVEDGHHRISVALALGDSEIEAAVTRLGLSPAF